MKTNRLTVYDVEIRKAGSPMIVCQFRNGDRAVDWAVKQTEHDGHFVVIPRREERRTRRDLGAHVVRVAAATVARHPLAARLKLRRA